LIIKGVVFPTVEDGLEGVGMRHSVAAMCDDSGKILAAARFPEAITLHTTPHHLLKSRLELLARDLYSRAGLSFARFKEATVCVGLTGTTFEHDRKIVLPGLFGNIRSFPSSPICTGDAEIAFAGNVQTRNGSALLCHSGSTAYIVTHIGEKTHHVRFGGWGPAMGDEGSGYSMGCSALRAISDEHDRDAPDSILWQEINRWLLNPLSFTSKALEVSSWMEGSEFWRMAVREVEPTQGIDSRTLLFYFAHKMQPGGIGERPDDNEGLEYWRRIASGLVIPLVSAYRKNDPAARDILERAADALTYQLVSGFDVAKRHFGLNSPSPVVLYGGVLTHNSEFRELVVERAQKHFQVQIAFRTSRTPRAMRPVCGALLFALGNSSVENLRLPEEATIQKLLESQETGDWRHELEND
jgi:N-acetylglucosamine kinase-like BadF-type ATPase